MAKGYNVSNITLTEKTNLRLDVKFYNLIDGGSTIKLL